MSEVQNNLLLSNRVKNAAAGWRVQTLADLKAAFDDGRVRQWKGIGRNSMAELEDFFDNPKIKRKLRRDAHKVKVAPEGVDHMEGDKLEERDADDRANGFDVQPDKLEELAEGARRVLRGADTGNAARRTGKLPALAAPYGPPLHEKLESMATQIAVDVARNYNPRLVVRALCLFALAEKVKERRP